MDGEGKQSRKTNSELSKWERKYHPEILDQEEERLFMVIERVVETRNIKLKKKKNMNNSI